MSISPALHNYITKPWSPDLENDPVKRANIARLIIREWKQALEEPFRNEVQLHKETRTETTDADTDKINSITENISNDLQNRFKEIIGKLWRPLLPDFEPPIETGDFSVINIKRGFEAGIKTCTILVNKICLQLREEGNLTLSKFRNHIQIGMDFIFKLASLKDEQDLNFIERPLSLDLNEREIRFAYGLTQGAFDLALQESQSEGRGCPMKRFTIKKLDLWDDGKKETVNFIKALYWLIAKQVERELFKPG